MHYEGIIWRFNFLMIVTMVTALLTVIGFAIGQIEEGKYHWSEDVVLHTISGFMTGVYGLWNIYVMGLLFLYAPSHKRVTGDDQPGNDAPGPNGEEIEFAVSSVSGGNVDSSEFSSLTDFIRHQATD